MVARVVTKNMSRKLEKEYLLILKNVLFILYFFLFRKSTVDLEYLCSLNKKNKNVFLSFPLRLKGFSVRRKANCSHQADFPGVQWALI